MQWFKMSMSETKRFIEAADKVVHYALTLIHEEPSRTGGYLCVADAETGQPLLVTMIGVVSEGKAKKYFEFAQEKARRLAENPSHISSFESRNAGKAQYGGAVRADKGVSRCILSFSGLPEIWDEACMTVLGEVMEVISPRRVGSIDRISNSIAILKLRDTFILDVIN